VKHAWENKGNTSSLEEKMKNQQNGYSLTEIMVSVGLLGILSSIALPTYFGEVEKSSQKETQSVIATIPPIISAYIDSTGELPTKWDELSSIAAVMTNNGPATGDLTTTITLPNSKYELSVAGPAESIYIVTASPLNEVNENRFPIYSCFNVSNGASDLKSGNGIQTKASLNCG
jgi:prepilin-type N-terminal cleavage/methylation domain-containing protein